MEKTIEDYWEDVIYASHTEIGNDAYIVVKSDFIKAMEDYAKQKLNLSGIGSKPPTGFQFIQITDEMMKEFQEFQKARKAACASGGQVKTEKRD